ncbi:MAG: asparaginase [Flavobacteriales bacterium]|nr:asparaginase [Flavobacteriales bacterium]
MQRPRILIIYTGGTIGMIHDVGSGTLVPFTLEAMLRRLPAIPELELNLSSVSLRKVIDSSNMSPMVWQELTAIISDNYHHYDGFVILHGSDTMAYTASALSFMLSGLAKPVILTGSQLPIGLVRTDARENIITSLMLAAMQKDGRPMINEVCIYFEDRLFRGNRTHKSNAENFDAFRSANYPVLADAGVHLKVHEEHLLSVPSAPFQTRPELENNIAVLPLYPGIDLIPYSEMFQSRGLRGLVLETFGAGNGPEDNGFLRSLRHIVDNGAVVVNVSQCRGGKVQMEKYATGRQLLDAGVISGSDMTVEAAITKLMHALAYSDSKATCEHFVKHSQRGEMTD